MPVAVALDNSVRSCTKGDDVSALEKESEMDRGNVGVKYKARRGRLTYAEQRKDNERKVALPRSGLSRVDLLCATGIQTLMI